MSQPRRKYFFRRDDSELVLDEGDNNSWAVSYSDLLMVLMSFFVLYFAFDDKKGGLQEVYWNLSGKQAKVMSEQKHAILTEGVVGRIPANFDANLLSVLKGFDGVKLEGREEILLIHLPDALYYPGQVEVKDHKKQIVTNLVRKLLPHSKNINLTVVGHSDSTPLTKIKNYYIKDNFSLSAMRASRVISELMEGGFPKEQLYIRAGAQNLRNTRSLSFQISMKGRQ